MFRLSLNVAWESPQRLTGGIVTDWIDDLANKAKELYSAQREEDERFNREQKLLEQFSKEYLAKAPSSAQRGSGRIQREIWI